ncbi:hypothetical protein DIS24_g1440 [Lasiodiplodia hormozganensis]|uniref:Rhodopsin domain-containing protein n=1 Tax=Lasiodiplodia hormozganensis TaxID=869390 RepID=A0AA39Z326_9PEZI|nr:hypothetical protein DIS24_g1440 [Lasiodiplodia hormozganensis]
MSLTDDLSSLSWTVSIVFFAICAISFAVRLYARGFVAKAFTWDDRFMAIAFVWNLFETLLCCKLIMNQIALIGQQYICWEWLILGGGKHTDLVSSENLTKIRRYELIEQFYYLFVHVFLKLSFLLYFYRTLYSPRFSTAIRITAAVVIVQTVASWVFYALQCRPLGAFINPDKYPYATCYPYGIAYYAPAAVNVAIIVLVYVLPIPTLTQRPLPQRQAITTPPPQSSTPTPDDASDPERTSQQEQKPTSSRGGGSIIALFILVGAGIIVSGLRVVVLYQQSTTDTTTTTTTTTNSSSYLASTDRTYNLGLLTIATTVEFSIYVFAGNLPAIRALLSRVHERSPSPSLSSHEMHDRRGTRRRRGDRGAETDEDELWGVGEGGEGKITITSRVSISITEALRGKDGPAGYPKKYFKFSRPGAQSPTPNFLKDV